MLSFSTTLFVAALALASRVSTVDLAGALGGAFSPPAELVAVPAGIYTPVFPASPAEARVPVRAFLLDRRPVTNADYAAFTRDNPGWRRGQTPSVVADGGYLSHWATPDRQGAARPLAPVVRVSWFAAKAYCEARGARLPTEVEWEYVASASEDAADGRKDAAWAARILGWYGRPGDQPPGDVGLARPNFYGIEDLHGLVWEWVLDFNSTLVSGDAREGGSADRMRFCGSGALAAVDKGDYATFMRVAMRSSLSATYTAGSLGFRCAKDGGTP